MCKALRMFDVGCLGLIFFTSFYEKYVTLTRIESWYKEKNKGYKMVGLYGRSFMVTAVISVCAVYGASAVSSEAFVQNLGKKAIDTLTNGSLPDEQIKSEFRSILEEGFAVTNIAKFVMGNNWRKLDSAQQDQFRTIFAKRLENAYAARFREYKGVAFTVKGSRQESDGGVVVSSTIQKPGGPIINVDWKIYSAGGSEKIFDVTVDGVSMSITLRSDYSSAFQSKAGNIGEFLKSLS